MFGVFLQSFQIDMVVNLQCPSEESLEFVHTGSEVGVAGRHVCGSSLRIGPLPLTLIGCRGTLRGFLQALGLSMQLLLQLVGRSVHALLLTHLTGMCALHFSENAHG